MVYEISRVLQTFRSSKIGLSFGCGIRSSPIRTFRRPISLGYFMASQVWIIFSIRPLKQESIARVPLALSIQSDYSHAAPFKMY